MAVKTFIDQIYEAAIVPERWSDVLATFARTAGAKDAVLIAARGTSFLRWLTSSPEFNEVVEAHSETYAGNLRTARLIAKQHAGFLRDLDVMTQEEINREPVYQEFLIPRGYGSGVATAIFSPTGDDIILHAEYGHTRGPQRPELIAELDRLRPHFARAALLSSRLGLERARVMTDALATLGLPCAVLRERGQIYAVNPAFVELMPDVVQDRRDRVYLANDDTDRLLADALTAISLQADDVTVNSIPIPAVAGRLPTILHLLPIRGAAHDVFSEATSLLIVTQVDRAAVPSAGILQGLFDLTPAEARVAHGIGEAMTVRSIAEGLGVSNETVRSQLKSVLSKTGLGRQVELVRLLASASRVPKSD